MANEPEANPPSFFGWGLKSLSNNQARGIFYLEPDKDPPGRHILDDVGTAGLSTDTSGNNDWQKEPSDNWETNSESPDATQSD